MCDSRWYDEDDVLWCCEVLTDVPHVHQCTITWEDSEAENPMWEDEDG